MILFLFFLTGYRANFYERVDYEWKMGYGKQINKIVKIKSAPPENLIQRAFKICLKIFYEEKKIVFYYIEILQTKKGNKNYKNR